MAFIVLGRCKVTKSTNKIFGTNEYVGTNVDGEHIVLYDTVSNSKRYIPTYFLAHPSNKKALDDIPGYILGKGNTIIIDRDIKEFKGQLVAYHKINEGKYWSIISLNNDAAKLISVLGKIQVISLDNLYKLIDIGKIINLWVNEDETINIEKYDKLDGPYQLTEIKTDDMEVDANVSIEKTLKEKDLDIDTKEIIDEVKKKKEKDLDVQLNKDIGQKTLQSIASIDDDSTDKIKKLHEDRENKYNIYKYVIENIQYLDVISIPNDVFKRLITNVHIVLSSAFKSNGEYKNFRWIASLKFNTDDQASVIGIVSFDENSEFIRFQAFSVYEFTHVVTQDDIETMYKKHRMEMKYI